MSAVRNGKGRRWGEREGEEDIGGSVCASSAGCMYCDGWARLRQRFGCSDDDGSQCASRPSREKLA